MSARTASATVCPARPRATAMVWSSVRGWAVFVTQLNSQPASGSSRCSDGGMVRWWQRRTATAPLSDPAPPMRWPVAPFTLLAATPSAPELRAARRPWASLGRPAGCRSRERRRSPRRRRRCRPRERGSRAVVTLRPSGCGREPAVGVERAAKPDDLAVDPCAARRRRRSAPRGPGGRSLAEERAVAVAVVGTARAGAEIVAGARDAERLIFTVRHEFTGSSKPPASAMSASPRPNGAECPADGGRPGVGGAGEVACWAPLKPYC